MSKQNQKQIKTYHIGLRVDFTVDAENKKEALQEAYDKAIRVDKYNCISTEFVSVTLPNGEYKRLDKNSEFDDE